jgi:ribosomal 30S subunit maturation factor RimM
MSEKLLLVGLVGRTHGLRGGFIVAQRDKPIQFSPSRNNTELKIIKIGSELTKAKSYQLVQHHNHGDRTILFCKELASPEQVKIVQGARIWLPRSLIVEEDAPEILWGDLMAERFWTPMNSCALRCLLCTIMERVILLRSNVNLRPYSCL